MFVMNPEFQRNLRLQFSVGRLLAAPLIIILLALVGVGAFVGALPFVIGILWASRLAAGTVLDEIGNRTWDTQRMSTLSVWSMTWGKLLGSVSYTWYCLFWVFASRFLLELVSPFPLPSLEEPGLLLIACLFAQVTAFLVGIMFAGTRLQRGRVTIAHVAGILAGSYYAAGIGSIAMQGDVFVTWYGERILYGAFVGGSMLLFSAWGIFGAYRLFRLQLGYRNLPWAFLGFQLFLGCYLLGFLLRFPSVSLPWILCSLSVAGVLLSFFVLLWDEMSLIQCQRFASAWRRGHWKRTLAESPISVVALLGVLFFALPATLMAPLADGEYGGPSGFFSSNLIFGVFLEQPRWQFPSFLFLLRDAGLFWTFCLRDVSGRGKWWGLIVTSMLHIWPQLFAAIGNAGDFPSWFWFAFQPGPGFSYAPVLVELFLVGAWLGYEWNRAVARQLR